MIKTTGLSKYYVSGEQTITALDKVSIHIAEGEFVAIMGRSGSGKSTLLNMLGCMDRPDAGEYWLNGENVSTLDDDALSTIRNRHIGFIFQSFHLLPRASALDNVRLPLRFAEHRDDSSQYAQELLRRVDLADRAGHRPNQMSGGQRQRVAIARALINRPSVILADEPTGNLDSNTSDAIMALLGELHQQGQTIIMVTHEADIAECAQRTIVMRDGRVLE